MLKKEPPNIGLHPSDVLDVHHRSEKERKRDGICTKFMLHPTLTKVWVQSSSSAPAAPRHAAGISGVTKHF